jgi:hypothetical protein
MRRLIVAIAILLAFALNVEARGLMMVQGGPVAAAGPTYLFNINFAGAADGTWTNVVTGASWNDDYTTSCPNSQAECLSSDGSLKRTNSGAGNSPAWGTIAFSIPDEVTTGTFWPFMFLNGTAIAGGVRLAFGATNWYPVPVTSGGGDGTAITGFLVQGDGTTYYLKVKYTKAPGVNDGEIKVWTSTDGTTWGNETTISNNALADNVDGFRTGGYENTGTMMKIGTVKMAYEDITDAR